METFLKKNRVNLVKILIGCTSLLFSLSGFSAADEKASSQTPMEVTLFQNEGHINNDYVKKLLRLALDKSGISYSLRVEAGDVEQGREINFVKRIPGSVITIGTSKKYEKELYPVRIPVYRGMLGYRVGIINKLRQPEFSAVQTIDDFRKMSIGQGIDWSDTVILETAGFEVVTADYQLLFKMVERNRFDIFLRGINEAFDEIDIYRKKNPDIAVENDLVLYYPFAMFFFVNRDNKLLGDAIERGLKQAYDDGSFLDLFNTHQQTKNIFKKAKLNKRRIFEIDNPTLSTKTQLIPDRYWLFINDYTPAGETTDDKSVKD